MGAPDLIAKSINSSFVAGHGASSNFDASSWSNKSGRNWEYNSGKSKRGKGRKGRR